jgi:hypothetical protein
MLTLDVVCTCHKASSQSHRSKDPSRLRESLELHKSEIDKPGELRELLAVDDAVFHYEGHFLKGRDVLERVAGDGDDVGVIARLQRADLILPA